MLNKTKFEEIISSSSSHSAHKSLKNGKNSLITNGKLHKQPKRKKLDDIVRNIAKNRLEFKQVHVGRELTSSCLENEEDGDEDIILVEPIDLEKELDILINFGSIKLKDESLIRSIREILTDNDADLSEIFESSINSFVEVYAYSRNNS